jgi:hypothetical protein
VSSDDPDRRAIQAAADRLLTGTPLRSTGKLTIVQLANEAGVKRWLLTHKHRDLAEQFQARVRAAGGDPPPVADLKIQIGRLAEDNTRLRADNAERKAVTTYYAHIINELSTELEQVTAERDQMLGKVRAITAAPSLRRRTPDDEDL